MAGFMEPGESIFDAARREIKEETGLELQKVVSHSTQPWPFPGSLMCGCVGLAKEGSEMFEPEEDVGCSMSIGSPQDLEGD